MWLTNEWYYFTSVLGASTCKKMVELWSNESLRATVDTKNGVSAEERKTGRQTDMGMDETLRKSTVMWLDEKWVYELVVPYMQAANREAGWQFEITTVEKVQLTRYDAGGFYTWHKDSITDRLSAFNRPKEDDWYGMVRKLSMTVLLNDDYEGGNFEFSNYERGEFSIAKPDFDKVGSIIVFPSFMEHRVTPVTKGVRYSLVVWFLGPPFK